jgi:hypothetical protein
MALADSVTGDGILVSYSADINTWQVLAFTGKWLYTETTSEEVREWVALTEAAAKAAAEAASQSGLTPPAVASYVASEDNRVVGSYKLVKTISNLVTTRVWEAYP